MAQVPEHAPTEVWIIVTPTQTWPVDIDQVGEVARVLADMPLAEAYRVGLKYKKKAMFTSAITEEIVDGGLDV